MSEESHSVSGALNRGLPKALSKGVLRTFGESPIHSLLPKLQFGKQEVHVTQTGVWVTGAQKSGVRYIPGTT